MGEREKTILLLAAGAFVYLIVSALFIAYVFFLSWDPLKGWAIFAGYVAATVFLVFVALHVRRQGTAWKGP